MKKAFLPPIAVLAAILTFSLWNSRAMTASTDRWRNQLQQADALMQAESWPDTAAALSKSYEDWSQCQTWLHIVSEHDAVDDAEAMYQRAQAFAAVREAADRAGGPARPAAAAGGDGAVQHQKRTVKVFYFSASSLFSSVIKVSISLNWRYTEAKRT